MKLSRLVILALSGAVFAAVAAAAEAPANKITPPAHGREILPPGTPAKLSKAKKAKKPVAAEGVFKWTTLNRNNQPIENVLTVSTDKKGVITGTLFDRSGERPIVDPVVAAGVLTFKVLYPSPGVGDVPVEYSVNLDADDLKVSVEKPDITPEGKAAGKKVRDEVKAKHETKGSS